MCHYRIESMYGILLTCGAGEFLSAYEKQIPVWKTRSEDDKHWNFGKRGKNTRLFSHEFW